MNSEELWKKSGLTGTYHTFSYGSEDPEKLLQLTIDGIKHATTGAKRLYEIDGEAIPEEGQYSIIEDEAGNARCIIQNIKVIICPFNEVTEEMAAIEGEGDQSLTYWKNEHKKVFSQYFAEEGLQFTPQEEVVFEQFKVIL